MDEDGARQGGRCDTWRDRLSEYADGELRPVERRAVARHLAGCADCAAVVADLREVAARGGELPVGEQPATDLWPGIASRLTPRSVARRRSPRAWPWGGRWLVPQLGAAALVLVACGVFVGWAIWGRQPAVPRVAVATARPAPTTVNTTADTTANPAEASYEREVADLRRLLRTRLTLDPHVVEVLDQNLATLDAAIADYRKAESERPGDKRLDLRIAEARQRKLDVLRRAVALASEGTN
jgi:anti-sigma factor RsiW